MTVRSLLFAVALIACGSSTPRARVASPDGVALHYVVEGTGPAVVLAHCLGCNLRYWDVAAANLARDHRVVRLDLAGHGSSGAERTTWTVEAFAADIRAVVNAAGVERFTIVGHSMSGTIALEVARELGDRVTGVVPVDSVLDVDAHMPANERATIVAKLRTDYRSITDAMLPALMPKDPDPAVVARVRADAMALDPDRAASILDAIFAYPEAITLDHLTMPIIAIDSDRRPVALDHNRAHAPQFDARVLENTGHWLMLDKPADFARTLRAVLESIESGTASRRSSSG